MDLAIITLSVILILFIIEIIFRIYYYNKHGRNYHVSIKFPWRESHVIPHPFLSLAYRRNSYIDRNQRLPYPIHTNKYFSFKKPLRINNLGHFGKDFSFKKPDGTLRIACLGHSSTANNIADEKGLKVIITDDLNAVQGADVIATDTWVSLWYENQRDQIMNDLKGYTITE